jgi:hypothetical protein
MGLMGQIDDADILRDAEKWMQKNKKDCPHLIGR